MGEAAGLASSFKTSPSFVLQVLTGLCSATPHLSQPLLIAFILTTFQTVQASASPESPKKLGTIEQGLLGHFLFACTSRWAWKGLPG